jgi:hypothetical protein
MAGGSGVSTSTPLFLDSARTLADDLEKRDDPMARRFAEEARRLQKIFATWQTERPRDDDRINAIKALLDLQRHVLELGRR